MAVIAVLLQRSTFGRFALMPASAPDSGAPLRLVSLRSRATVADVRAAEVKLAASRRAQAISELSKNR